MTNRLSMNLSIRRIGEQNLYYRESDTESAVQLIFTPGSLNPELWRNQYRYFSKKYRTVIYEPTRSNTGFKGEKTALKSVLGQKNIDNAILISNPVGNHLVQGFEQDDSVAATFTSGNFSANLPPRSIYKLFCALNLRKPKLLRKTLFSKSTEYRVLKQFSKDVRAPEYRVLKSFLDRYSMRQPMKPSKTVYSDEDRFSSLESIRSIQDDRSISLIRRAGTFSFYEKPQEYNKILNDFLTRVEESMRNQEVMAAKENNRSLFEFEKKERKVKIK